MWKLGTTSSHGAPVAFAGLWRRFRHPVDPETRVNLDAIWDDIAPEFQTENQMFGRHEEGCGATIGVMPRCDFACRGCYLAADANRIPAMDMAAVMAQMRLLRQRLGPSGNLQLTDGEVTLRPLEEVIELLRYGRAIGLIPMLMTHGDSFRRTPGLLERLMVEGGLEEVSVHIDTTQRGRQGAAYKYAIHEAELMPLRAEFAEMVRRARQTTGRALRVATTVTVTPQNVGEVADIVAWIQANADVFRMVGFMPVADVGRTEAGIGRVDVDALWREIARGLNVEPENSDRLADNQWWMGHPGCSRFVIGASLRRPGEPPRYLPLSANSSGRDRRFLQEVFDRWAGVTFRADRPAEALARIAGMIFQAPGLFVWTLPRMAWHWLRRLDRRNPFGLALRILTGTACLDRLMIASHHFMSAAEMATDEGRERLDHCSFMVPVEGELKSMCEVNAAGLRDRVYASIARSIDDELDSAA
ncbi:MAG: MoaA/NifB/PqqE/SkfB family radical SAM enzyme [Alphaproteobacteria bacterium]|jgi:MoaA/NifB/PqqE/SkfB family radical SAM enzyme